MNGKYLITTDNYFRAPDGKQYNAVWGNVTIIDDSVLGIKTNRNSTNWYARIGTDEHHVIVAGCQIHYAIKTEIEPPVECFDYEIHEGKKIWSKDNSTRIYKAI